MDIGGAAIRQESTKASAASFISAATTADGKEGDDHVHHPRHEEDPREGPPVSRCDTGRNGTGLWHCPCLHPQPEPPGKPITSTVNPPDVNRGAIIAVNPAPERPSRPQVAAQFGG